MAEDMNNGYEVIQLQPEEAQMAAISSTDHAEVDIQVATAHRYPRSISRVIANSIEVATLDVETAQAMGYALPRGNKPITGPSVHLARLLAQNYGNMRAEARVVQITDRQVVSRGIAWDLETNYAAAFEVRRSIVGKNGRFNDDMITVTGNAANAIAFRNAVLNVIPKGVVDKVYRAAQRCITGDLTDEEVLIKRRQAAIKHFNDSYGITEDEVVKLCGKYTVNQIRASEIALLLGIVQSLKDGDTTVDEVMRPIRESKEAKKETLKDIARQSAKRKGEQKPEAVNTETGETGANGGGAESTVTEI